MVQHSQLNTVLLDQIRECYGRVVWTHKTHEKCADILDDKNNRIKFWQIVLSAVTTTGVFAVVFGDLPVVGYVSALVSLLLTIINAYVKKYDLGGLSQKHSDAANTLWNIRESYLSLITDMHSDIIKDDEVRKTRDFLQASLHKLYKGSPSTNVGKAYEKASEALKKNEELTFSDEEIDMFLPKSLRKTSKH
ncbi:SLATT domain-containing protein [Vibrio alginolyticus]|uniref:SLATT domain-containing protein n=1 Tax=Vibrio alginolyticus TaxID=663 RepID=UPI001F23DDFC|nr:SLATT domain-containing protein [Vibrio alginolyticus]MCE9823107.1 SLATT domain-containing protein [Vibrio alginolyticus]